MASNISLSKYKSIARWLENLSEDELVFIDAFIEEIEFELEELLLQYSDYRESIEVIRKVKDD